MTDKKYRNESIFIKIKMGVFILILLIFVITGFLYFESIFLPYIILGLSTYATRMAIIHGKMLLFKNEMTYIREKYDLTSPEDADRILKNGNYDLEDGDLLEAYYILLKK